MARSVRLGIQSSRGRSTPGFALRNHMSAKKDDEGVAALIIDDIIREYNLPLPLDQVQTCLAFRYSQFEITIQIPLTITT